MKKIMILGVVLWTVFIGGCAQEIERPKLEDYGLVEAIGFDVAEDKKMRVIYAIPQYATEVEAKTKVYSEVVDLNYEALNVISRKADKTISYKQLRVILVSEDFARERGLEKIIKELYREPEVSNNVYIAILKGRVEEYLTLKDPEKPSVALFLADLLKPRKETAFNPFTTIHDFIYTMTNEISDPMLPYIEKENNEIEITKVAMMKGDKMIGTIDPWEANLLYGLAGRKRIAAMKINISEEESEEDLAMLEFVESDVKIKSNKNMETPRITIHLNLKGQLFGYPEEVNIEDNNERQKIQNKISKEIKKKIENMLSRFQEMKIDPIETGESLRMYYTGDWSKEMWNERLAEAEYDVKVEVEITTTGSLR